MHSGSLKKLKAFTLIELLVVLTILALLLTIATPRYFDSVDRAKEASLKQSLHTVRDSIDKYFADTGRYPDDLDTLVDTRYINKLPMDPITESIDTWVLVEPEPPLEGGVYDLYSGAEGVARDGTNYSDW